MKKVANNPKQKLNIKSIIRSNTKLLTGLIVGLAMTGVVYATSFASIDVAYDNTSSNLSSDNVQDAIDELKKAAENCGSGATGLQVGDYVTVVPDKSTYTIAGSQTDYHLKTASPDGTTANLIYSKDDTLCCSNSVLVDQESGFFMIDGEYTKASAMAGKYCDTDSYPSEYSGRCYQEFGSISHLSAVVCDNNATSSSTQLSCKWYMGATSSTTANQIITPNELTLWRIINVNDNGTYDAVSEYTSSTKIYFKGTTGYSNLAGGLQTIAAQYEKSGITVGTRMMGYDGQTLTITNTSAFNGSSASAPSTTSTDSPTTGTGQEYSGGVLGDTLYLKDYLLVQNVYQQDNNTDNYCSSGLCAYQVGTTTKGNYWMPSREYYYTNSDSYNSYRFYGRSILENGTIGSSSTYTDIRGGVFGFKAAFRYYEKNGSSDGSWTEITKGGYLRPILTLKSGISITGGYGLKSQPYTIS